MEKIEFSSWTIGFEITPHGLKERPLMESAWTPWGVFGIYSINHSTESILALEQAQGKPGDGQLPKSEK